MTADNVYLFMTFCESFDEQEQAREKEKQTLVIVGITEPAEIKSDVCAFCSFSVSNAAVHIITTGKPTFQNGERAPNAVGMGVDKNTGQPIGFGCGEIFRTIASMLTFEGCSVHVPQRAENGIVYWVEFNPDIEYDQFGLLSHDEVVEEMKWDKDKIISDGESSLSEHRYWGNEIGRQINENRGVTPRTEEARQKYRESVEWRKKQEQLQMEHIRRSAMLPPPPPLFPPASTDDRKEPKKGLISRKPGWWI